VKDAKIAVNLKRRIGVHGLKNTRTNQQIR